MNLLIVVIKIFIESRPILSILKLALLRSASFSAPETRDFDFFDFLRLDFDFFFDFDFSALSFGGGNEGLSIDFSENFEIFDTFERLDKVLGAKLIIKKSERIRNECI